MTLKSFKSVVYNRKDDTNSYTTLYEKSFIYDEVKEKLYHNLNVMPKDEINGVVYIWKFDKTGKVDHLKIDMEERYADWKHEYRTFVKNFNAKYYIYYISTVDVERGRYYRTIISLIPKNENFEILFDLIDKTSIEYFIKNSFIKKTKEQLEKMKNKI